ncbi:MAG: META domain-containing protein, partial [Candidatus Geothermarchaeales archaeon]
ALLGQNEGVHLDVKVPTEVSYVLDLTTSNGRIVVTRLNGDELSVSTSNGRVVLTDIDFEVIDIGTSNGRISGVITASDSRVHTSNGGIDVRLLGAGNYELRTSNGDVDVSLEGRVPAMVDAETSNGDASWHGVPIVLIESGEGRLVARTEGYVEALAAVNLLIRTSNGHIEVSTEGDAVLGGEWTLQSLLKEGQEAPLLSNAEITIRFEDDLKVRGSGGCNGFSGSYSIEVRNNVIFGPIASTEMACQGLMEQERVFFEALDEVITYEVTEDGLRLLSEDEQTVLTFGT